MAKRKLTAKQIAAGFGGKRAQSAQKSRRKPRKASRRSLGYVKERKSPMARKRRRASGYRRVYGRARRVAKAHRTDFAAAGVVGIYGYLQGSESQLLQDMPVFTPVGRAGTIALLAYGAAKLGIAPKYTSAIARGMVNVAVYNLARRKFKFYDETEGKAMMSGADEALLLEGAGLQDEDMMGDVDEVGAVMEYDD